MISSNFGKFLSNVPELAARENIGYTNIAERRKKYYKKILFCAIFLLFNRTLRIIIMIFFLVNNTRIFEEIPTVSKF